MSSSPARGSREAQLHSLLEQIIRASRSPGSSDTVLIQGPQTHSIHRFVDDAITAFKEQGHLCLEGNCENTRGEPIQAFAQIVKAALLHLEDVGEGTPLAGVLASFGWTLDGCERSSRIDNLLGRNGRLNLLEALRRLLLHVAKTQPTVLVIRHLDHADDDTVEILCDFLLHCAPSGINRDLGKNSFSLPPMILELPMGAEGSEEIRERLEAIDGITVQMVEGLDRDAVEKWLTSDDVVARIHSLTQGNPVRMKALLQALPTDMEDLISRRYSALPKEGRVIAHTLTLAQEPMRSGPLREACELTELETARGIASLQTGGLLHTLSGERHRLLDGENWILEQISDRETTRIHESLGDLYSTAWTRTQDEGLLEHAAHHFMAAGNRERTIAFCLQAGAELQGRYRLHAAKDLYRTLVNWDPPRGTAVVAWSRLAEVYTALDQMDAASDALEHVLSLTKEKTDPATLVHLGEMQLACGHVDLATESLETALSLVKEEHAELETKTRLALAQVFLVNGDLDKASTEINHASLKNHPESLLIRGNTLFRQGRHDDASQCYAEATTADDPILQLRASHNLGLIAIQKGRHKQAIRFLHESQRVAEVCGSYFGVAISQINLGIAYEHMERFALAEQFLTQAAALFERLGRRTNLISALSSLGDLRLRLGEPRSARRLLLKAMTMARAEGNAYETEWARMKMGLVEVERQRWGRAEDCLERASTYFRENGHREDLAWSTLYLARIFADRHMKDEAFEHLLSLDDMELPTDHEISALALLVEARLKAEEHPDDAMGIVEDALTTFTALRQREPQIQCWSLLASIQESQGDRNGAQDSARQAAELLDDLKIEVPLNSRKRFLRRPLFRAVAAHPEQLKSKATSTNQTTPDLKPVSNSDVIQDGMMGKSKSLMRAIAAAKRLAKTDAPVLLLGESGTGKERFAELIYQTSERKGQPFVRINAAALPDTLLESELFGHEKGAFTGATMRRRGRFEQANGGVLFLDEIGDISPKTQVSLLRVLEEKRFQRLGGHQDLPADIRLIFATNRNLEDAVARGAFRLDLYHRISGLSLTLPPLRERGEDIHLLAQHFLSTLVAEHGRPMTLSPCARRVLMGHRWPGNIRELENTVRTAYLLHDGDTITGPILREMTGIGVGEYSVLPEGNDEMPQILQWDEVSLDAAKQRLEVDLISQALSATDGNITKAAALLKVKRPRLSQKIKEYGIRVTREPRER